MAIAAVSIAPLGTGSPGVSHYVAHVERILREDGRVKYRLDPMFTTLEGDLAVILDVIRKMHESLFATDALRVGTVIKIDDRRDKELHMQEKVDKVERLLKGEDS